MTKRASEEALDELHGTVARVLTARMKTDEVTAAEIAVAVKFLKDNAISGVLDADDPIRNLANELSNMPLDELLLN